MNINEKDLLTIQEFAKIAGIHYNTVRNMIKNGRLNAFKIGCGGITSDYRIPKSEIQRLSIINHDEIINYLVEKRINEKQAKYNLNFFEKVEKTQTCWIWKGAKTSSGYGVYTYKSKYMRAHRASYLMFKGEIPTYALVLHSCNVRDCVNPDHLHLGTPKSNMDEMVLRNRQKHLSGENHPFFKLSDSNIRNIKKMRNKKIPAKVIAKKYKISACYVYQISKGIYRNKD